MSEEELQMNLSLVKDEALKESLNFGIGLHHAGLVESDRQLAEQLFAHNKVQVLVATSTLAWGVNLPAHLVVVKGTQYFDARMEGYKDMDLTDVLQMMGRAGRPQFDDSGIARIFTQDSKKEFYKHFLHTGFPVESSLHLVLDNHLGAEVSAGTISTKQDALDYLTWTFFFRRLYKNPSYYGLEILAEEQTSSAAQVLVNDFIISMVDDSLSSLLESTCIEVDSYGNIDSTPFGRIMSYYYLSHFTIRALLSSAKRHPEFSDALGWMCKATEFDELPVRHNEDLINAELSSSLPIKADSLDLPMWDPHIKAFLLLQAHFSRIELPISDYVGDQNSVLDQSIRILQAAVDIFAELGYLSSLRKMILLLQCIKSGQWPGDGSLAIFPGISTDEARKHLSSGSSKCLADLVSVPLSLASRTLEEGGISKAANQAAMQVLARLPNLTIDTSAVSALGMTVHLTRKNRPVSADYSVYAPNFPKAQSEGFFVVAADTASDEVLALRRTNWPDAALNPHAKRRDIGGPKAMAILKVEPSLAEREVNVFVISDAYVDLEWTIKVIIPAAPSGREDKEKQKGDRKPDTA